MADDRSFERLAKLTDVDAQKPQRAPAKLRARIYSELVRRMAASGPLLSLTATKADGRRLCVFEEALAAMPIGERAKAANPCGVCHARVLGERLDRAPIFWRACPYSEFHNG
jgi:hypothetical protein